MENDHIPRRPDWTCSCGEAEWPDEAARAALQQEFADASASLSMYLTGQWISAVADLPGADVAGLYQRMVGWRRERT